MNALRMPCTECAVKVKSPKMPVIECEAKVKSPKVPSVKAKTLPQDMKVRAPRMPSFDVEVEVIYCKVENVLLHLLHLSLCITRCGLEICTPPAGNPRCS